MAKLAENHVETITCSSLWKILIFRDSTDAFTNWSCFTNACFSESKMLCACFVFTLSETSYNKDPNKNTRGNQIKHLTTSNNRYQRQIIKKENKTTQIYRPWYYSHPSQSPAATDAGFVSAYPHMPDQWSAEIQLIKLKKKKNRCFYEKLEAQKDQQGTSISDI